MKASSDWKTLGEKDIAAVCLIGLDNLKLIRSWNLIFDKANRIEVLQGLKIGTLHCHSCKPYCPSSPSPF